RRSQRDMPTRFQGWPAWLAISTLIVVAFLYTTPWDNYLVATGVWWYDPALVTGIVWGWVPIEEYTFFVVQTLLGGLWLLCMFRYWPPASAYSPLNGRWRVGATAVILLIWLGSVVLLVSGWQPGTYLGLELIWALPPIAVQLAFGADILWRYRRYVLSSIVILSLYLSATDALAISSGTWTIDPQQSLGIYLGGILPVEEFIFFLLTNILVICGITLLLAQESHERFDAFWQARVSTLPNPLRRAD
ncbi:MAG: lycopene cyclase domain-containing protein, partial [Chloroflexota bacterium]